MPEKCSGSKNQIDLEKLFTQHGSSLKQRMSKIERIIACIALIMLIIVSFVIIVLILMLDEKTTVPTLSTSLNDTINQNQTIILEAIKVDDVEDNLIETVEFDNITTSEPSPGEFLEGDDLIYTETPLDNMTTIQISTVESEINENTTEADLNKIIMNELEAEYGIDIIYQGTYARNFLEAALKLKNNLDDFLYPIGDYKPEPTSENNGWLDFDGVLAGAIYKIQNNSENSMRSFRIGNEFYTMLSILDAKKPVINGWSGTSYIIKSYLAFRNATDTQSHMIYVTEPLIPIHQMEECNVEDARKIIRAIATTMNLLKNMDTGYLIKNFDKIHVFATVQKDDKGKNVITSARFLDDGNFVKLDESLADYDMEYLEKCKKFLLKTIRQLSRYLNPVGYWDIDTGITENENSTVTVDKKMDDVLTDLYLLLSDCVENRIQSFSEILDHPFINGQVTMPSKDRWGKRTNSRRID